MMHYHIQEDEGMFILSSMVDDKIVTRMGARPKLSAAQRLAEQTAGRRLTWVKRREGGYTSA